MLLDQSQPEIYSLADSRPSREQSLADAQGWLQLCQLAIEEGLAPMWPDFLNCLQQCLPLALTLKGKESITVEAIGSIHPLNHALSYRPPGQADGTLRGGISLRHLESIVLL